MSQLFDINDIGDASNGNLKASATTFCNDVKAQYVRSKAHEITLKLFGKIATGQTVLFCTAGEFSTHNLLQFLLTLTGPANVYLSTWTLKEEPARVLHQLKKSGHIKQLNCVFDYRIRTLDAKHFDFIKATIDRYVLTKNHSKAIAIEGEKMNIAVISSANMSNNPRIETGVIICTNSAMEFNRNWMMDVINGKKVV